MRIMDNLGLFFTGLIEKIFRRKALLKYKTSAGLLEDDVDEKDRLIELLTSGYVVHLNHQETLMILLAIEYKNFREKVEAPLTKAIVRRTWRSLREKIKLHIKEDPVVDEIREAPESEPEVKEDDETREAKNEV